MVIWGPHQESETLLADIQLCWWFSYVQHSTMFEDNLGCIVLWQLFYRIGSSRPTYCACFASAVLKVL